MHPTHSDHQSPTDPIEPSVDQILSSIPDPWARAWVGATRMDPAPVDSALLEELLETALAHHEEQLQHEQDQAGLLHQLESEALEHLGTGGQVRIQTDLLLQMLHTWDQTLASSQRWLSPGQLAELEANPDSAAPDQVRLLARAARPDGVVPGIDPAQDAAVSALLRRMRQDQLPEQISVWPRAALALVRNHRQSRVPAWQGLDELFDLQSQLELHAQVMVPAQTLLSLLRLHRSR